LLEILGYVVYEKRIYNANDGEPVIDKYGNTLDVDNVAIVPNPDGAGHILINGDVLTISEYLGDLANMEYSLMKKNKEENK